MRTVKENQEISVEYFNKFGSGDSISLSDEAVEQGKSIVEIMKQKLDD